jgi:hypothetical protein
MGKFKADQKFNSIFKNSGAKTVFIALHELFPRADWSKDVPKLDERTRKLVGQAVRKLIQNNV